MLERGRFYASRGRTHAAEADFASAYALGSRDSQLLDTIIGNGALFQRLVNTTPGTAAILWDRRGHARITQKRWTDAAADFNKAVSLAPNDILTRRNQIRALLAAGDSDGLRRACSGLLDHFGSIDSPETANTVAWICVLAPDAIADPEALVRLAELAVRGFRAEHKHLALNTLGAALYRAGRFRDAIRRLEEGIRLRSGTEEPTDWLFFAMAYQRLGHREEPLRWLNKLHDRQPSTEPSQFWTELEIRLLRSEAEAVILHDPVFPADPFAH